MSGNSWAIASYNRGRRRVEAQAADLRLYYDARAGAVLKKAIARISKVLPPGYQGAAVIVTPDGRITLATSMSDAQARSVIKALAAEMSKRDALRAADTVIGELVGGGAGKSK